MESALLNLYIWMTLLFNGLCFSKCFELEIMDVMQGIGFINMAVDSAINWCMVEVELIVG